MLFVETGVGVDLGHDHRHWAQLSAASVRFGVSIGMMRLPSLRNLGFSRRPADLHVYCLSSIPPAVAPRRILYPFPIKQLLSESCTRS